MIIRVSVINECLILYNIANFLNKEQKYFNLIDKYPINKNFSSSKKFSFFFLRVTIKLFRNVVDFKFLPPIMIYHPC